MLQSPPQEDLRNRTRMSSGDADQAGMAQSLSSCQRTVGLDLNTCISTKLHQVLWIAERCKFHLIHCGRDIADTKKFFQMVDCIVAHTDRAAAAAVQYLLHGPPCSQPPCLRFQAKRMQCLCNRPPSYWSGISHWPVDQI